MKGFEGIMIRKKLVSWFSFLIFMVALLSAQSLVELAKKEKERRAKLKKKSSVVVTNADLARIKKKPAVEVTTLPPPQVIKVKPLSRPLLLLKSES